MKIAEFCIRHKVTTFLIFVIVVIFGLLGFSDLSLALLPNIDFPMAVVYATYPGAGPEEVEELVTRPLESACATVSGMEELTSTSSENMSMVMVTFSDGTNMDMAALDLREKIDLVKSSLPEDCSSPTVMTINPDMMPAAVYALSGRDLADLQNLAEDVFSPAIERVEGVASVDVSGGVENEISVVTKADRLAGYNLSLSYISGILASDNVMIPAGTVQNGSGTLSVRTDAQFTSIEDIRSTLIPLPTGGSVRLDEIADVSMTQKEVSDIAKVNGQSCVLLTINKQSDVNTVAVSRAAEEAIDQLAANYSAVSVSAVMDQRDYIDLSVDNTVQNIVLGVLLAAMVLLFFLRDGGATLVIAVSMPVCIISVFLLMQMLDITLNMMSLGGIAMGVGMIVDNSIVVLENIFTHRADGKSRWEACIGGAAEISLSITASTLTTVVVFLPIGLASGLSGQIFRDFCLTIAALLLSSLFIALTLVPLLCYFLLDEKKVRKEALRKAQRKAALKQMEKNRAFYQADLTRNRNSVNRLTARIRNAMLAYLQPTPVRSASGTLDAGRIWRGVPSMTTRPRSITTSRSARAASSIWWVMRMMVIPFSRFSRWTAESTSRLPTGSSMAVASSSTMHAGSMAMTPAMAMRCFWPPESWAG